MESPKSGGDAGKINTDTKRQTGQVYTSTSTNFARRLDTETKSKLIGELLRTALRDRRAHFERVVNDRAWGGHDIARIFIYADHGIMRAAKRMPRNLKSLSCH